MKKAMEMLEKHGIVSIMASHNGTEHSLTQKIHKRVWRRDGGSVFTAEDFADVGERGAFDMALSRLAKRLTFKGGTSLSKAFGLISGFLQELMPNIFIYKYDVAL